MNKKMNYYELTMNHPIALSAGMTALMAVVYTVVSELIKKIIR